MVAASAVPRWGRFTSMSGEQLGTGRCEPDEGATLMHDELAALLRQPHARAVLRRARLVAEKERVVDQLDEDAPVLHRLDGAGDLDDAARGLLGISVGSSFGVSHAVK
jgi:hypothetical protein